MGFSGWFIEVDLDFWQVVKMEFAFMVLCLSCAFVCLTLIVSSLIV